MKILLTGAAGSVGKIIANYLNNKGYQIIPIDLTEQENIISIDLRHEQAVSQLFDDYHPDLIIHLAAIKDIQFCEQHPDLSHTTNYVVTQKLTEISAKYNTRMIYFSSDYIFGNSDQFWNEDDPPCPSTQYGKDKAAAEVFIQEKLSNYAIIRSAQIYGIENDFITLVHKTVHAANTFKAFSNLVNCPTWINDLLTMLDIIIAENKCGIFHCIGPEALSRYEFALIVTHQMGLDPRYIEPITLDFSIDIRPSTVKLNGKNTYRILNFYPQPLVDNFSKISLKFT